MADLDDQVLEDLDNFQDFDIHGKKHRDAESPASLGEEGPSGGATSSESMDIDEELQKVGLHGDTENGPQSLDLEDELQEEAF